MRVTWFSTREGAMLASALGSLDENSDDYKFRGMHWWPFDSADTTEAWKGADHHCSVRDIWAKRPTMRTEDEIAEREAAARVVETTRVRKQQRAAVEGNMYLCTYAGCEREQRGRGFGSIRALEGYHAWHNRETAIAEDRHLCTIDGCDRAIPGRGLATPLALQQHMVFHFKLGIDAYLCTYDDCGRSQADKGFKPLQTLERHFNNHEAGIEVSEPLNKHTRTTCIDARCGHVAHEIFLKKHEKQHLDGQNKCRACGLPFYHAHYANEHALLQGRKRSNNPCPQGHEGDKS